MNTSNKYNYNLYRYLGGGVLPMKLHPCDEWGLIVSNFILQVTKDKDMREAYFPKYSLIDDSCIIGAPRKIITPRYYLTPSDVSAIRAGNYETMHQLMEKYITLINKNPGYYLEFFSFVVDSTLAADLVISDDTTIMH